MERYGGVVEKFIGDAVFGVWGVPAAHEDDAERAVRAGLELAATVAALGEEVAIPDLRIRVGITTGQVAVTLGAVGEGMVAGDAVNTAARVQSVAAPGQVWVDDTTRSLTTAAIAHQSVGTYELKGKAVPVELFHAVRTVAGVGGDQRVDGPEAAFVGRDRELRVVKELFHQTFDDRRARVVLVAGEPGAGSSRLAWEFEKYVDAIATHSTWWLRGRCLSYGQASGGRVLAELVRSHLRVTEGDSDADIAVALDRRLEQHFAEPADREDVRPTLLSLLGLSDARLEPTDLFVGLRRLLEAMTTDGSSVTLTVDDLQWADDAFLDFVEHLLEAGRAPILVLGLTRPELVEQRPTLAAGRRATTVFLDRLSDEALGELLDSLVARLTPALRAELVARAAGIPLYAVETVRVLVDRGAIALHDGGYVLADPAADLEALGPPTSLTALLAARLDALPNPERRLVQDASVLGIAFSRAGLGALAPDDVDIDAGLEALRRKEIFSLDLDPRSPERGSFRFVQTLLRSVAYDTIGRRDKRDRHLAAAAHLAAEHDVLPAVRAQHLLDARAALPEADDVVELVLSAASLLEQAAEDAWQVGAGNDAIAHRLAVLALPLDDRAVVRNAVELARLHTTVQPAETAAVEAELRRAHQTAADVGDRPAALLLLATVADIVTRRDVTEAQRLDEQIFAEAVARSDAAEALARACSDLAYVSQFSDEAGKQRAFDGVMAATLVVEEWGGDRDFDVMLGAVSTALMASGRVRFADVVTSARAARYDRTDPRSVSALANLAAGRVNDLPLEAMRAGLEAMERARALGMPNYEFLTRAPLLFAAHAVGEWDLAAATVADAAETEVREDLPWQAFLAAASGMLAWGRRDRSLLLPLPEGPVDELSSGDVGRHRAVALALDGDLDAAAAALDALTAFAAGVAVDDLHPAAALACDLRLAVGDRAGLDTLSAMLLAIPPGRRLRLTGALVPRVEGHRVGDPALLLRSIAGYEEAGAAYWAAHVRVELAVMLAARGEDPEPVATAALPLLTAISAVGDLAALASIRPTGS